MTHCPNDGAGGGNLARPNVEDVGLVEVLQEGEPMVGAEGAGEVGDRP